jgi:hypothetical protein
MPSPAGIVRRSASLLVALALVACGSPAATVAPSGACGSSASMSAGCATPAATAGPAEAVVEPLPSPVGQAGAVQQPDGTFLFQPISARVVPGVAYAFSAFTHCGFTPTTFDFDGSFWRPATAPTAGQDANPPAGIDNPEDAGAITLVGPNEAVFTSHRGIRVPLVRVDGQQQGFPCD